MSTASLVPPTVEIPDGAVRASLSDISIGELLKNAFVRFRHADGFSFARSLAFQVVLAIIPGVIFAVALAVRLGEGRVQSLMREALTSLAPGPASQMFLTAFEQGSGAGRGNQIAMVLGGLAALVSGVAGMAQLQRGASRIYGVQSDRPTVQRYGLATALTFTVGLLLTAAFLVIVLGSSIGGALRDDVLGAWAWGRWPVGIGTVTLGLAALFKIAPNRPQPSFGWLTLGGVTAVIGWLLVSVGLALYLNASALFGETYGPLAGFIGFMIWAFLSSIAIFYGLAVAAQLEARSAGVESPTDEVPEGEKS